MSDKPTIRLSDKTMAIMHARDFRMLADLYTSKLVELDRVKHYISDIEFKLRKGLSQRERYNQERELEWANAKWAALEEEIDGIYEVSQMSEEDYLALIKASLP